MCTYTAAVVFFQFFNFLIDCSLTCKAGGALYEYISQPSTSKTCSQTSKLRSLATVLLGFRFVNVDLAVFAYTFSGQSPHCTNTFQHPRSVQPTQPAVPIRLPLCTSSRLNNRSSVCRLIQQPREAVPANKTCLHAPLLRACTIHRVQQHLFVWSRGRSALPPAMIRGALAARGLASRTATVQASHCVSAIRLRDARCQQARAYHAPQRDIDFVMNEHYDFQTVRHMPPVVPHHSASVLACV